MKINIHFEGLRKTMWLLTTLLLTCSCGEEFSTPETIDKEGGIPLQLSVSMENSGFSSDSEVIPMGTRTETKSYVVTLISNSTLYIVKKEQNGWALVNIKKNIIDTKGEPILELKSDELLNIKPADEEYVLLPGKYRFLLLVNAITDSKITLNEIFTQDFPCVMTTTMPVSDFFFAQCDIELVKTDELDKPNPSKKINLELKRNSALIRFVMEKGQYWKDYSGLIPTISYNISGSLCKGVNILGDNVTAVEESKIDSDTEIIISTPYQLTNNKEYYFATSSTKNSNSSPSLYMDEGKDNTITLTINKIGHKNQGIVDFNGTKVLSQVPVQRNHITTIVIRKTKKDEIECEVNPQINNWDEMKYCPLNYIELNNK